MLRGAVQDVVNRQIDAGIDIVDDGEMGKASWITYLYERVSGLETRVMTLEGDSMMPPSRDRQQFPGAYAALDALDEAAVRESNRAADSSERDNEPEANQAIEWVCTGPITYDRTALDRDIANLRAALEGHDDVQAFMPVVAPASAYWLRNEHYASEEEFVYGLADALREEYRAIVDSGFFLQVDDAVLMHEWDSMLSLGQTDDDYRRWAQLRVDALNHALEGLPPERIRYHVCWGSWHGPHAYDPPLRDTIDLILQVNAGYYAMEQANPRHEHEWRVWEDVPLPRGQEADTGRRDPSHQRRGASGARRAALGPARQRRRQGQRPGRHRLRICSGSVHPPGPPRDPVGQARSPRRGCAHRKSGALGGKGGRLAPPAILSRRQSPASA